MGIMKLQDTMNKASMQRNRSVRQDIGSGVCYRITDGPVKC